MKFSILIANYNNGKYFKDCYESIIAQTYKDWKAIIVDDKSTDNSVGIIKELIKNDSRFFFYENDQNRGCGYTKNRCTQLATGEVCGFVDPDDALLPEAIELMVCEHALNPDCSLVHSSFYYCDENLKIEKAFTGAQSVETDKYFTNFNGIVSHFSTFKSDYYQRTEGIDSTLLRAVDQDLYLKLAEVGSFKFLDKVLYKYRIHNAGISNYKGIRPFYYHIKALINAEKRRHVNFEDQIQKIWESYTQVNVVPESSYDFKNLENPRYLLGKLWGLLLKSPANFMKKLIQRESKEAKPL